MGLTQHVLRDVPVEGHVYSIALPVSERTSGRPIFRQYRTGATSRPIGDHNPIAYIVQSVIHVLHAEFLDVTFSYFRFSVHDAA